MPCSHNLSLRARFSFGAQLSRINVALNCLFKRRKLRNLGLSTLKVLSQATSKNVYHIHECVCIYMCVYVCIYTMYIYISIQIENTHFNWVVYDFNSIIQQIELHFCVYLGMSTVLGKNNSFMAKYSSVFATITQQQRLKAKLQLLSMYFGYKFLFHYCFQGSCNILIKSFSDSKNINHLHRLSHSQ